MTLGQRATTVIDEGEYSGTTAVVDQIIAWPLYLLAQARMDAYLAADAIATSYAALKVMVELYIDHARPVWTVEDLQGPVPAHAAHALLRVPTPALTTLYEMWVATYPLPDVEPAEAAPQEAGDAE